MPVWHWWSVLSSFFRPWQGLPQETLHLNDEAALATNLNGGGEAGQGWRDADGPLLYWNEGTGSLKR